MKKSVNASNAYSREWTARRRAEFFSDKRCIACGSVENLELDHIDPSTKVAKVHFNWSQERRDAEIAKCQVLCHDCHIKKTSDNKENTKLGVDHYRSRYTEDQVIEMRKLHSDGMSLPYLMKKFGGSKTAVHCIVTRKTWKHLPEFARSLKDS